MCVCGENTAKPFILLPLILSQAGCGLHRLSLGIHHRCRRVVCKGVLQPCCNSSFGQAGGDKKVRKVAALRVRRRSLDGYRMYAVFGKQTKRGTELRNLQHMVHKSNAPSRSAFS